MEGVDYPGFEAGDETWASELYPDDADMREFDLDGESWAFAELRRLTKVSCWHAVAPTVGALKRALREFRLQPTYVVSDLCRSGEHPIERARMGHGDCCEAHHVVRAGARRVV